ncbi:MAG: mercury resistance system transport protein MerF [Alphaproteobacteria bacterium]
MKNRKLLSIGIVGSVVAALCCFTPLLVVVLGLIGLSALTAPLDLFLVPALILFLLITVYALWKQART